MGREFQRRRVLPPRRRGPPPARPLRGRGGEERLVAGRRGLFPARPRPRPHTWATETQVRVPRAPGGWLREVLGLPPAEAWPRPLLPPWGGWTAGLPACQTGLTAVTCLICTCYPRARGGGWGADPLPGRCWNSIFDLGSVRGTQVMWPSEGWAAAGQVWTQRMRVAKLDVSQPEQPKFYCFLYGAFT